MADLLTGIALGNSAWRSACRAMSLYCSSMATVTRKTIEDKVRSGYEGRSSIQLPDGTTRLWWKVSKTTLSVAEPDAPACLSALPERIMRWWIIVNAKRAVTDAPALALFL